MLVSPLSPFAGDNSQFYRPLLEKPLRLILHFIVGGGSIVERALLNYVTWSLGPHMLNLIILSFEFELAMHFNVISLLGIFVGWYYYKYSY